MIRMPFGKHRGEDIRDVPSGYLHWVLDNCGDITLNLQDAIGEELARRLLPWFRGVPAVKVTPAPRAALREALGRWHREQARRWHPDKPGGDIRVCQAINSANDELTAILGEGEP